MDQEAQPFAAAFGTLARLRVFSRCTWAIRPRSRARPLAFAAFGVRQFCEGPLDSWFLGPWTPEGDSLVGVINPYLSENTEKPEICLGSFPENAEKPEIYLGLFPKKMTEKGIFYVTNPYLSENTEKPEICLGLFPENAEKSEIYLVS